MCLRLSDVGFWINLCTLGRAAWSCGLCTSFLYLSTQSIFLRSFYVPWNIISTNYMWALILARKTDIKQIIPEKRDEWHEKQSPGELWEHRTESWAHPGGQGNPSQRKVGSEGYQPDLGQVGEGQQAGEGGHSRCSKFQVGFKGSAGKVWRT